MKAVLSQKVSNDKVALYCCIASDKTKDKKNASDSPNRYFRSLMIQNFLHPYEVNNKK